MFFGYGNVSTYNTYLLTKKNTQLQGAQQILADLRM